MSKYRDKLLAAQSTSELRRKSVKSTRKGFGKRGSCFRGTLENYDLNYRAVQDLSHLRRHEHVLVLAESDQYGLHKRCKICGNTETQIKNYAALYQKPKVVAARI